MLYHQDLRILGGRPEARLRLTAKPDVVFEPSIERVDPTSLESGSRSRFIYGVMEDEKGDLEENMLGRLTLIFDKSPPVLAVPLTALDQDGSRWHVFVYDEAKDQFAPRQVELGRRDDLHAEILSGLKQGEKVAVSAVAELRRGYGRIK
jgi:macrolide-specific efflux system membrane fusion protein